MNRNSRTALVVVGVIILLCVLIGVFANSLNKTDYTNNSDTNEYHECINVDCYENKDIYMTVGETETICVEVSTANKELKKTTIDWETDKDGYLELGKPCIEDDSHISIDVEALKEGEVVLTAMATCDSEEYVTFTIIISEEEKPQEEPKPQKVVTTTKTENKTQTTSKVYVSSIDVSPKSVNLEVGESKAVSAVVNPSNATDKGISWKSNNTSVAKVDQDGLIKAVGAGSTTVTATATDRNNVVAVINVTVTKANTTTTNKDVLVKSITLNPTRVSLEVGDSRTITATVKPTNATDKELVWESSNTSVAKVNQNGRITAVGRGNATVTALATDGSGIVGRVNVTVTKPSYNDDSYWDDEVYVTSVTVNPSRVELEVGETETLRVTVKPTNATDKDVSFKSNNTSVAKVNSNGKVTAVGVGCATITVTATDGSREYDTVDVVVSADEDVVVTPNDNKAPVVEITGANNVAVGQMVTLTVRASDENLENFVVRESDLLGLTGGASINSIRKVSNNTYEITLMGVEVSSLGLCVRGGVATDAAGNVSAESNEVIVFINSGE